MFFSRFFITIGILFSIFFIFLNFTPALADSSYGMGTVAGEAGLATSGNLETKIGTIVSALLGFIGIVFFGLVLYAGFEWMTALGNKEKAEKAKTIIEAAAIGIVIILAAYAITKFVFTDLIGT